MFEGIDLSSDTATRPTFEMKQFMLEASLGDEQRSEDPTTLRLEMMAAELFGFECATFLPSATMANIIAIRALSKPGEMLLAAENSHILRAECGGAAIHANVMTQPLSTLSGIFMAEQMLPYLQQNKKFNYPSAGVISIENTTNLGGGCAWAVNLIRDVISLARRFNVNTHLDGSRIFNASVKTGVSVSDISSGFDMVTVCLSKGLGCPVGSMLVYNKPYNDSVQYLKKLFGGAMRQSGILSAAGIYALNNNIQRLTDDHKNAILFAEGINALAGKLNLVFGMPETNMVYFELEDKTLTDETFVKQCREQGLRFSDVKKSQYRAVFHSDITYQDTVRCLDILKTILIHS